MLTHIHRCASPVVTSNSRYLSQGGHFVIEAAWVDAVVRIAHSVVPWLILVAIVRPESNGLESAARLRRISQFYGLVIIPLGWITPVGMYQEPLTSLVNDYVDIDVPPNDLLFTIDNHLLTNNQLTHVAFPDRINS